MKKGKVAFITGITGFAGSHLAELLLKKGYEVHGLCRWRSRTENITQIKKKIHLIEGDLLDAHSLQEALMDARPNYIFHLAAQSFVPASWTSPTATLEINVVGSGNLFEAVRSAHLNPAIQIACCYDKETKVLTSEGLKSFLEVKKGDLVLSINPRTSEVSLKPVEKMIIDDYQGEMIYIKGKRVDLMITPNHSCYFQGKRGYLKPVLACNLTGNYYLPRGKSKGKTPKKIRGFPAKDLLYLLGLYIGDGYGDARERSFITKTGLSREDYLKICRNLQGKFKKIKGKQPGVGVSSTARVFLAIPKGNIVRKRAERCLKKLHLKYSGYDNCIYFSSKLLFEILKTSGGRADDKKIPRWVFEYSPKLLGEVYRGLIDSDGSWRKGRESFTTISFRLVETFIELCARLGLTCTYRFLKQRPTILKTKKIITSKKGVYSLSISHKPKQVRSSLNVYRKNYKGKIWCLKVADNHTLMVSKGGKTDFCGNSSEEYGLVKPNEVPIKETNPLRPLSPYAVSKIAMDYLGYQYFRSYGIEIVRTRGFNHTGPRRGEVFAESTFAKQIAEIEKGLREPVINVGNLEAKRDYTDVLDMVNGYFLAASKGEAGEVYNICSGKAVKISRVLEILMGFSKIKMAVHQDPLRMRPSDVPILQGDSSKFRRQTGWQPKIPLTKTLKDLLNYWRENI